MRFSWVAFFFLILTPIGPAHAEPLILKYGDREVDLSPYYFSFPYHIKVVNIENNKIYYAKDYPGGRSFLYVQPLNTTGLFNFDTQNAKLVSNVRFRGKYFSGYTYNRVLDAIIGQANKVKTEVINLWLYSEKNSKAIKLTKADYIYGFAQSPDHHTIAYTSRYGSSDDQEGCLELLTISDNGETSTQKLFCDSDNKMPAKLNWWAPLRIDDKNIIFTALANGERGRKVLYRYDRASEDVIKIASSSDGSRVSVINTLEDERQVLYALNKQLFLYNIASGTEVKLHEFMNAFRIVASDIGGRKYLLAITKGVSNTTFEVFLFENNSLVKTDDFVIDMDVEFEHVEGVTVILKKVSADTLIDFEKIEIDPSGRILRGSFIKGLAELNDQLAKCKVSQVTYSYVDTHGGVETHLDVDAYLYEPRSPIAEEDRLYIIEAFYGGRNSFSRGYHIMCHMGITVLSPVVRGDNRFGVESETLNDGKNADAPIRDVIAGARYLRSRYSLADSRRVGTMGYSHGGWAAVRALSYPGPEHFEFGFALAGAGVYDLLQLADGAPEGQTNIRGWFDKEFGNLDTEREHLAYLSATSHMDQINAPIFLYHGRNDERITVLHSISFAKRLRAAQKIYKLMIVENQGHTISGAKSWHQILGTTFKFLGKVNGR